MSRQTKRYHLLKDAHRCVTCAKDLPEGYERVRCPECSDKGNRNTMWRYNWYIEHHVCPRCKKEKLFGDEKACPECRAKYAEAEANRREVGGDELRKYKNEYEKSLYKRRKEQGLCPKCGKRKPTDGYVICGVCNAKQRMRKQEIYERMKYEKIPIDERYLHGLCRKCDSPVKEGYKVCERHYKMNIDSLNNPKTVEYRKQLRRIVYGRMAK